MATAHTTDPDALQFEALLNARAYLYEMFYHLTGGVPTTDLLGALSNKTVQDMIEEYEDFAEMRKLADLLSAYTKMDADEAGNLHRWSKR